MDWGMVISALCGLLSGGGAMSLLNWRAGRRKAAASAGREENESAGAAVDALNRAIDTLQEERDRDKGVIAGLTAEREKLLAEKIGFINAQAALLPSMCVHLGCVLRKPVQGQADRWLDAHSGEPLRGADYKAVNVLLREYGQSKKEGGGRGDD